MVASIKLYLFEPLKLKLNKSVYDVPMEYDVINYY